MSVNVKHLYLAVFVGLLLVIYGFIYNEARKEVYFLCSNFVEGMPKVIVEEQLATAQWSTAIEPHARELISYSALNLYIHQCTIEFDLQRKVTSAKYTSF
ncbi:hypothetical protein [Glaciecola sp. 1036]|uniref:hypothetical protein n=1 Tax=Alteromonadaceae TaxID=72275 RepID=UPI003D07F6B7